MPGTVTVACKIPNGLVLRGFKMAEVSEPVMGGGTRTVSVARHDGRRVEIKGPAAPFGEAPSVPVHGGYALTHGVDADFMADWIKQNAQHPAVVNNLIFVHEKHEFAVKQAKEQAEIRTGLERIDPAKALPKGIQTAAPA